MHELSDNPTHLSPIPRGQIAGRQFIALGVLESGRARFDHEHVDETDQDRRGAMAACNDDRFIWKKRRGIHWEKEYQLW